MTIDDILFGLFLLAIAILVMTSTFWTSSKKKLAPVDGMAVLHDTHTLVETGNYQINNRLVRLEKRIDNMESKLDILISLSTPTN